MAAATLLAVVLLSGNQHPVSAQSGGAVLVSNTGQTSDGSPVSLDANLSKLAQGFTTGPNVGGYVLTSLGVGYNDIDSVSTAATMLTVTLNEAGSDSGPGGSLCTLDHPTNYTASAVNAYSAPNDCPTLTAQTKYFVVIERTDHSGGALSLDQTEDLDEDTNPSPGWSVEDGGVSFGDSWATTTQSLMIEVEGNLVEAPGEEIWAADMTVGVYEWIFFGVPSGNFYGYYGGGTPDILDPFGSDPTPAFGSVTPSVDFTVDGTDYTVVWLTDGGSGPSIVVTPLPGTNEINSWTLVVDGLGLSLSSGTVQNGQNIYWGDLPLTWTDGSTVSVSLKAAQSDNQAPSGLPTISGTAQTDQILTADTAGITDPDGLVNATFTYQWIRVEGATETDIPNATSATYTLTDDDVGKTIKVRVTFTDDGGYEERLTSEPTAVVTKAPGVNIDPTDLTLDEDGTGTYTVVLDTEPAARVTISVSAGGDVSVKPTDLTFTPDDWNAARTVTVSAARDDDRFDDSVTVTHTATSTDGDYNGVGIDPVEVTVREGMIFVTNTEEALWSPVTLPNRRAIAQGFTTGTRFTSYTLYSIGLYFQSIHNASTMESQYVATLNEAGSDSSPGDALCTLTHPESYVASNVNTYDAPAECPSLEPGTTYFFVLSATDQSSPYVGVYYTRSTSEDSGSPGWTIADDRYSRSVSVWSTSSGEAHLIEVRGFPSATFLGADVEPSELTVHEGGSNTYEVRLGSQPTADVTVDIAGGGDVTTNPASLTFTASDWNMAQEVTASAAEDNDTVNDVVTVTHAVASGSASEYVGVSIDSVEVTVDDNDDAGATLSTRKLEVNEGDNGEYTVKLDTQPTGDVTIDISAGGDLSVSPSSLSFTTTDWSTAQTVTVSAAADDDSVDDTITITHTVASGSASEYVGVSIGDVEVTVDDREFLVSFGQSSYTATEGSSVTVKVLLSDDPEQTVTIPLSATGQGGATGDDYSGVPTGLTFESGDTEKTFSFTAAQDTVDDDGESVDIGFGTLPTGFRTGSTDTTTVSITDDDVPQVTVSFEQSGYTVAEGSSVDVKVTLSADPERTVTIPLSATGQGGATGDDYSGVPTGLTFESGETEKTFSFTAAQDTVDDDDESVDIGFGTLPAGVSTVNNGINSTTVSITDDDVPSVFVKFGQVSYTVAEGSSVSVKVLLTADPERTVVIPLDTTGLGGVTDDDYSGVPSSVTFNSGDTEKSFSFSAARDSNNDDGESVRIRFVNLPAGVSQAGITVSQVYIYDVPSVTVSFEQSSYTAAEGGSVSVKVLLSADPERQVIIPLSTTNQGGATSTDYSGVPTGLTFESGDTEKSFSFSAAQDTDNDDGESVDIGFGTLPAGVGTVNNGINSTTVSITDDDVPQVTVSFQQSSQDEVESDKVYVTVNLSADPEREVTIPLSISYQGGATSADFSGIPTSITFNAGDLFHDFDFFTVTDIEDEDGESVDISFGTLPAGVSTGDTDITTTTVNIDEPTSVTISFGQSSYTVAEGDSVDVKVLVSPAPEVTPGYIVLKATRQGGATASDFSFDNSLTIDSGQTENTFSFMATDNTYDDDGKAVVLSFGNLLGFMSLPSWITVGTTSTTTVSITDDDVPSVIVSFKDASYTVAEGSSVDVTVRIGDPERTVTIPISASNENGATDDDYSGVPSSVTFNSGDTEKTFSFSAAQDMDNDDGEWVELSFGTLPAWVFSGIGNTFDTTTVSITDDDDEGTGSEVLVSNKGQTALTTNWTPTSDTPKIAQAFTTGDKAGGYTLESIGLSFSNIADTARVEPELTATLHQADEVLTFFRPGLSSLCTLEAPASYASSGVNAYGAPDDCPTLAANTKYFVVLARAGFVAGEVSLDWTSSDDEDDTTTGWTVDDPLTGTSSSWSDITNNFMIEVRGTATPGVVLDPTELRIAEEGNDSYTVVLNTAPAADVTIEVTAGGDLTASPASLTFTTTDWEMAQTVTVTDGGDDDTEDDIVTITHSATSTDTDYNGATIDDVTVTVTDDDGDTGSEESAVLVSNTGQTAFHLGLVMDSITPNVAQAFTTGESTDGYTLDSIGLSFSNIAQTDAVASELTATLHSSTEATNFFGETVYRPSETALCTLEDPDSYASSGVNAYSAPDDCPTLDPGTKYLVVLTRTGFTAGEVSLLLASGGDEDDTSTGWTVDDATSGSYLSHQIVPFMVEVRGSEASGTVVPQVTVSFEQASYTVAEGSSVTVKVLLSADPGRTVVIPLSTTGQGGVSASDDYSGVPSSVTFQSGDTEQSFSFSAAADSDNDDGESVDIGFGTLPTGVGTVNNGINSTTVSITDDDVPSVTVSFEQASYTVAEGSSVTVKVLLSADPERTVVIPLSTTGQGGVSASDDYSGVPTSVTFQSGDTEQSFSFSAAADSDNDDGESVDIGFGTLPTGVGTVNNGINSTSVAITDDAVPQVTESVSFEQASYTVAEGSSVSVKVTLSADPERTVTIPLSATIQDGATRGDYSGVPTSLTFNSGETEKSFNFRATSDIDDDDGESVELGFRGLPTGVRAGNGATTTVSIIDNDGALYLRFEQPSYTVAEGSTVELKVILELPDIPYINTLTLSPSHQGGASSSDYILEPTGIVIRYDQSEPSARFIFTATPDLLNDGGESVELGFTQIGQTSVGGTTTVSIEDVVSTAGDSAVVLSNTAQPNRAISSIGSSSYFKIYPLSFTTGDHSGGYKLDSIGVEFHDIPHPESAGADLTARLYRAQPDVLFGIRRWIGVCTLEDPASFTNSGVQTFSATDDCPTLLPNISYRFELDSTDAVVNEFMGVVVTSAHLHSPDFVDDPTTGWALIPILGTASPMVIQVMASPVQSSALPQVGVSFEQSNYTVSEGSSVSVKVIRSGGLDRTVTVPISKTDRGGASISDYSGVPTSVTFESGDTEKSFSFSAAADSDNDDGESVKLAFGTLPTGVGPVNNGINSTSVAITDDDLPAVTVSFEQASYTVAEGSSVTVKVLLSADPERTVTIPLSTTGQGGVSATDDYSGVPGSVTFQSGDTEKSFSFSAAADSDNDDGESVDIGFGALPTGVGTVNNGINSTTVSITDDDVPSVTVSFEQASYTVAEGSSVTVKVLLSADPGRTVVIPLSTTGQGGASSSDYSGVPTRLTFNSGDTEKSFTFIASQDNDDDDGGSVDIGFGALPTGVGTVNNGINSTSVAITDDDVPLVGVSFEQASYTVAEGSSVTVKVLLSADPEREVVIPLSTTGQGGVSATDDYSGVPTGLTFNSGDTEKSFSFSATADSDNDDGESVDIGFGTLPAGVGPGTTISATVSITDDDVPQVTVSFGQSSYTAAEGGSVSVKVLLSADPERQVVIPLDTTNQGGATSSDYSGVPTGVTFQSGDTEKSFSFSATSDSDNDDGESVDIGFGTLPAGVGTVNNGINSTTVSITDDDVPQVTVSFQQSGYTAAEGGSVSVKVLLSADPERTVVIPLDTTNQGGATSSDYSGVPTGVTFQSGDTEKSFSFSATSDSDNDDGESVDIGFGTLPAGVGTVNNGINSTTVSITDDDVPQVTVSFGQSGYTAAEGGSVSVKVLLSADPERQVVIPLDTTNQGGATSSDYSGVPTGVTFQSGDTEKSFSFSATSDSDNDDGESVDIGFGTLPAGVGTVNNGINSTTVSITDDDVPQVTVSFGQSGYTAAEGGSVSVKVLLSADPERTVVIPLDTTNQGGATSSDYSGVPTGVTFQSGDTEKSFSFSATSDSDNDDGESVDIGFGTLPAGVGTVNNGINSTTVSITDDDVPQVTVSFGQSGYTAAEGGSVSVKVLLSADPERQVVHPPGHHQPGRGHVQRLFRASPPG